MKKAHREEKAQRRRFFGVYTAVVLSVLVVAMLATLIAVVWQKSTTPVPTDYEGTIVDRWADYAESDQGSRPRLALVVESPDRTRFTIRVEANVYASAKVGMRIKSRGGQIVLIEPQQKPIDDR
ncbi:MAG: hypothetical protein DMF70_10820 [Acidobacteria bacterium]|nr:MAG: hypothetical protein DMF70_10820 [Acidobacteriota bacterium]